MIDTQNAQLTRKIKIKNGKEDSMLLKRHGFKKVLFVAVFIVFLLYALSLITPFLYLFINSFKGGLEYINDLNGSHSLYLPKVFIFRNYIDAFTSMKIPNSLGEYIYMPIMIVNSLWYSILSVLSGIMASTLVAYCLAKYRFSLRGILYGIAIFSMTIPIIGSTGASFKLMHDIGIYNTPLFPIIAGFSGFGFNFLIMYGFFTNISWSYAEAVFLDGGGHFTVFFKIMLPQALPPMLTLIIMSFIGAWNDYMTILLYLPDFPTLASGLYAIQKSITRGGNYPIYFAGLIISIVPVLALFAGFSNTIMQNFTVGGLKG